MQESKVWDTLIEIQTLLEASFEKTGVEAHEPGMDRFNQPGWVNRVWQSDRYRRAHVDVVDARLTKGLWMMHCCIFHIHIIQPQSTVLMLLPARTKSLAAFTIILKQEILTIL